MQNLKLIIGNKNYSSWSLRAWLLLKEFGIKFDEHLIKLFDASSKPILDAYSPTRKVPVLLHILNPKTIINVSDSIAIAVYMQDYLTDKDIWSGLPQSKNHTHGVQAMRAYCQSIVAQMHAGFMGVRSEMPMNIRATARIAPSEACLNDLRQIEDIFEYCLTQYGEINGKDDYLLGNFSAADAFYAPVVLRLQTYAEASSITLRPTTQTYCQTMLANTNLQEWISSALQEKWVLKEDEAGEVLAVKGILAG